MVLFTKDYLYLFIYLFIVFRLKFCMYFLSPPPPAVSISAPLQRNIASHNHTAELSVSLWRQPVSPVYFKCSDTINVWRTLNTERRSTILVSSPYWYCCAVHTAQPLTEQLYLYDPPAPCSPTPPATNTPPLLVVLSDTLTQNTVTQFTPNYVAHCSLSRSLTHTSVTLLPAAVR